MQFTRYLDESNNQCRKGKLQQKDKQVKTQSLSFEGKCWVHERSHSL